MAVKKNLPAVTTGIWKWIHDGSVVVRGKTATGQWLNTDSITQANIHNEFYNSVTALPVFADIYNPV